MLFVFPLLKIKKTLISRAVTVRKNWIFFSFRKKISGFEKDFLTWKRFLDWPSSIRKCKKCNWMYLVTGQFSNQTVPQPDNFPRIIPRLDNSPTGQFPDWWSFYRSTFAPTKQIPAITIQFLATGESFQFFMYQYRVHEGTIYTIICTTNFQVLKNEYLHNKFLSPQEWVFAPCRF